MKNVDSTSGDNNGKRNGNYENKALKQSHTNNNNNNKQIHRKTNNTKNIETNKHHKEGSPQIKNNITKKDTYYTNTDTNMANVVEWNMYAIIHKET